MLNKICTDLETSKKLKELGVDLDTNFYWKGIEEDNHINLEYHDDEPSAVIWDYYKAYTLEQILEMLPKRIRLKSDAYPDRYFYYSLKLDMHLMRLYYNCSREFKYEIEIENENLATTAGKLLIKLIQDKIICLKE